MLARSNGATMRQIAGELNVSVSTIHEDVSAELLALRDRTKSRTEDLRDLEVMRMDQALRALHPVMQGNDDALRVRATRVWIQASVQRARLLGLYQHEGATDNAPQDFLVFLDEFWRRRRLGELGEGEQVIDIVPKRTDKVPSLQRC